ncbi:MAG TPA: aldo/keto reductase [Acidimicrobiales bacterium]|jgi:aryl-alcohol dehydrogenase-like predicted oxidoreductase
MTLPTSVLGRTGETVTKLGYGAMELRSRRVDPADADRILNAVLDAGINIVDTSPDYGRSEEHIGRAIAHRRDEYFLASKCGCPVGEGVGEDLTGPRPHVFTPENVRAAVEQSLRRMRTDHLDLVQVHMSPAPQTLTEQGALDELVSLRDEGKVRFIGMSGTLPNLPDQIAMGVFDVFQIPYSAVEREHEGAITAAARSGAGTVIRGGVAKGVPEPRADYPEPFQQVMRERKARFEQTDIDDLRGDTDPLDFMLRFTISHPDMHTTIVGTKSPEHLAANVRAATLGPLPPDVYAEAKRRFS